MKKRNRVGEIIWSSIAVLSAGFTFLFINEFVHTSHGRRPVPLTSKVVTASDPQNNSVVNQDNNYSSSQSTTGDQSTENPDQSSESNDSPESQNNASSPTGSSGSTNFAVSNVSPDGNSSSPSTPIPAVKSIELSYIGINGLGYDQDPTDPLEINEGFKDKLVFTARDIQGNAIPGANLSVTSSDNEVAFIQFDTVDNPNDGIPENVVTTDKNGQLTVLVGANLMPGNVNIVASCGHASTVVPLKVLPGAWRITVNVSQTKLIAGSGQPDKVTARVTDKNGNPIEGLTLFPVTGNSSYLNVPVNTRLVTDSDGEVDFYITAGAESSLLAYVGVMDPRQMSKMSTTPVEVDMPAK